MDYKINDPVVLEMLEGNDWRVIRTTYRQARRMLRKTHHRGYLLYREGLVWDGKNDAFTSFNCRHHRAPTSVAYCRQIEPDRIIL